MAVVDATVSLEFTAQKFLFKTGALSLSSEEMRQVGLIICF